MTSFFTLKRSDGIEIEIGFEEDEPEHILIPPSRSEEEFWDENRDKPMVNTAPAECFYRWDYNKRAHDAWKKKVWVWLKKEMRNFLDGKNVRAYYGNPYVAIGGHCTHD